MRQGAPEVDLPVEWVAGEPIEIRVAALSLVATLAGVAALATILLPIGFASGRWTSFIAMMSVFLPVLSVGIYFVEKRYPVGVDLGLTPASITVRPSVGSQVRWSWQEVELTGRILHGRPASMGRRTRSYFLTPSQLSRVREFLPAGRTSAAWMN